MRQNEADEAGFCQTDQAHYADLKTLRLDRNQEERVDQEAGDHDEDKEQYVKDEADEHDSIGVLLHLEEQIEHGPHTIHAKVL